MTVALVAVATPSPAAAAEPCEGSACGVPKCWDSHVRLRPDMTRRVRIQCWGTTSARLVKPAAHSDISDVSVWTYGVEFTARPRPLAPRLDEAVFEVTGHAGSIEEPVKIETIPRSENSAPVCWGDRASQRTDGSAPVDFFMHPSCYDPDGDEFVMEGGPPGFHSKSPLSVPAGDGEANWPYRTATSSGSETSTVWATDSLGARSTDAKLEVEVGPGVDRLPRCTPASWSSADVIAVRSRPGNPRRFAVRCEDMDADDFTARLASPPERGTMALVQPHGPAFGYWGVERWYDTTYVPPDASLEPDPFTITATGDRGEGPPGRMAIVPVEPPDNHGGGCGWSPAEALNPGGGLLRVSCNDDEGDTFTAKVVGAPRHGEAAPAVVTEGLYGNQDITVAYVPEPGYEGYDCVEVLISDGYGHQYKIAIDIWVRPAPPELPEVPELPELPELPLPPLPSLPVVAPGGTLPVPGESGAPPIDVRPMVEQILGTKKVKRVQRSGGSEVWARSKLSRTETMRTGEAPSLVVVCSGRCKVKADAELAPAAKALRSSRRKTLAALTGGQPHVLSLTVGATERRALRKARRPEARFRLTISAAGAAPVSLKRAIPFGR